MTAEELKDHLRDLGHLDDTEAAFTKLGFTPEFVAQNVFGGAPTVTVSHIAMLWQGMPNKHDRKRTRALFEALSQAGLLAQAGDGETWVVVSATA